MPTLVLIAEFSVTENWYRDSVKRGAWAESRTTTMVTLAGVREGDPWPSVAVMSNSKLSGGDWGNLCFSVTVPGKYKSSNSYHKIMLGLGMSTRLADSSQESWLESPTFDSWLFTINFRMTPDSSTSLNCQHSIETSRWGVNSRTYKYNMYFFQYQLFV